MPSIPCPCCKAANEAGPNCRRCKADLSLLFELEQARTGLLESARVRAGDGRYSESLSLLDRAAQLRAGADVHRLRAVLAIAARDFPTALRAYQEATARDQSWTSS
jgi:hypothetical protein